MTTYNRELSTIDTQEKAYLLGYFYGDGNNYVGKNGKYIVYKSSVVSKDRQVIEDLQKYFPFFYINKQKYTKGEYYILYRNSQHLYEDLLKWNVYPRKSTDNKEKLYLPKIQPNLLPHFVRGLYDSDGGFYLYGTLLESFFCSSSFNLINSVMEYLRENNIKVNLTTKHRKNCQTIYYIRSKNSTENKRLVTLLYEDSHIFLKRKRDSIEQADFSKREIKNSSRHSNIDATSSQKERLLRDYRRVIKVYETKETINKPSVCCAYHTIESGKSYKKGTVRPLNLCLKCGKKSVFTGDLKQDKLPGIP